MQMDDLSRLYAENIKDRALGNTRHYMCDQMFDLVRKMRLAEPFQLAGLCRELDAINLMMKSHASEVVRHFGVRGGFIK